MSRMRKRRGISFGTIFMLVVTVCVACAMGYILPQLQGSQPLAVATGKMLEALSLTGLPELSLSDIPIMFNGSVEDESTQMPVVKTANVFMTDANTATPTIAPTYTPSIPATATMTPIPTIAPTGTPVADRRITVAFTGSFMIEDSIRKGAWIDDADKYDFSEMLGYITPELKSADLCVIQLENVIAERKEYTDNVTTDAIVGMLVDAGVDLVGIAYPKVANEGYEGVASTIEALRSRGLAVTGAYTDALTASQPSVMTISGARVAFLQYTDGLSSTGQKKLKNSGAEYAVNVGQAVKIQTDIALARQAGAEIIVVCLNWGEDEASTPSKAQKTLAQQIADAGADVIVGTGTRAVQTTEWLMSGERKVLCAYSLGAFLNEGRTDKNVAGYILRLGFRIDAAGDVTIETMECIPTYTWRYKENGKYKYYVVPSAEVAPDDMSSAQLESKERALSNVRKVLKDSILTVPDRVE